MAPIRISRVQVRICLTGESQLDPIRRNVISLSLIVLRPNLRLGNQNWANLIVKPSRDHPISFLRVWGLGRGSLKRK